MNVHRARKVAKILSILNFLLLALVAISGYKFYQYWFLQPTTSEYELTIPVAPTPKPKSSSDLKSFEVSWSTNILANRPKATPRPTPRPRLRPTPPPARPPRIDYHVVSVSVHSDPQKSSAFLLKNNGQQQILVYPGTVLPGTSFRVTKISRLEVKIMTPRFEVTLVLGKKNILYKLRSSR